MGKRTSKVERSLWQPVESKSTEKLKNGTSSHKPNLPGKILGQGPSNESAIFGKAELLFAT